MRTRKNQLPGLVITAHEFVVPLDYGKANGSQIKIFAREVVSADNAGKEDLPWLIFFQGGPGFPSPRPFGADGWIGRAVQEYRVLLLDQRGTGLSSPVTFQSLARLGSASEQVLYLKHFRADAIVRDAETIRLELLGKNQPWSALGQSYGGFCLTHYLSSAPHGLKEVFITGGLPPAGVPVDDVYRATYRRVLEKNKRYYSRYPDDQAVAGKIVSWLSKHKVQLPGGGYLTPRRFQELGHSFGFSDGFEAVHYLLETAFIETAAGSELNYAFLRAVENALSFETNPIYALLHEACYMEMAASNWSAYRIRSEFPEFELAPDKTVFFTGEMIYPWMFDDYEYLSPLKDVAHLLADYSGWPRLYDLDRLASCSVPVAAAVFYDDMYVETAYSEQTAKSMGNVRLWITNEYEHNAIRSDGARVLDKLITMLK